MKMEHTAGKWKVYHENGSMGSGGHWGVEVDSDNVKQTIAIMPVNANARHNARLIAAAPELLEACKLAFERLSPGSVKKDFHGHVAKVALSKAIAKAEGRE